MSRYQLAKLATSVLLGVICAATGYGQGAKSSAKLRLDPRIVKAASDTDVKQVRALLATLVDPDTRASTKEWRVCGQATALHMAALRDNLEIARILVAAGAKVNSKTFGPIENGRRTCGATPLYYASSDSMVSFLVGKGALVNVRGDVTFPDFDPKWYTPLHDARDSAVALRLLELGADPNSTNAYEPGMGITTPLHVAADRGFDEVVRVLIAHGANVNGRDGWKQTPLIVAATCDVRGLSDQEARNQEAACRDVARILIKAGADVNARQEAEDKEEDRCPIGHGYTAVYMAAARADTEMVSILLDAGADVNTPDFGNMSPLHIASKNGKIEILKFLVSRGARADTHACNGSTPLTDAMLNHQQWREKVRTAASGFGSIYEPYASKAGEVVEFLKTALARP